jgi:hypothetical protein
MRIRAARLVAAGLLIAALTTDASSAVAPPTALATPVGPTLPIGHVGRWMTDADGRVVVLHGPNQVVEYPAGYHVTVQGGQVASAPNAPVLTIMANPGTDTVDVVVTPRRFHRVSASVREQRGRATRSDTGAAFRPRR